MKTLLMRRTATASIVQIARLGFLLGSLGGCVGQVYPYPSQPIVYALPSDVLFAFDSAALRPEASAALHQTLAAIRQESPYPAIRVEGNTDSIGTASYNEQLSLRRAQSVAQWLESQGIPVAAITEVGNAAGHPVAPNTKPDGQDNPRGRALNRRVDLIARPA
jgi:outer membrane protein OmpA-like peptidoglycan-associated protein